MNDECTPCCAHRYLCHVTKRYMNGCQSDHWECQDCGVVFIPRLPPPDLQADTEGQPK